MPFELTNREKWALRGIYTVIVVVAVAAMSMAFEHARNWADRHASVDAQWWEGWAFGVMIELPAVMGLLLLQVWPKIAPGRKPTIPRWLLSSSLMVSLVVQQAYAGPSASMSTRIVAGLPSLVAFIFVEIMFMLMGAVEEGRAKAVAEVAEAALKQTRQALGLGDIAPPPTLTSPPPTAPCHPDTTPAPEPTSPDTVTPTPDAVSPDIQPVMSPDISAPNTGHVTPTPAAMSPDIAQVAAHVTSATPTGNPWADTGDMSSDTEPAEHVAAPPNVTPDARPDDDMSPDTDRPDMDTDVTPTPNTSELSQPDMSPDTDDQKITDPRWAEAAQMRRAGATIAAIAQHFTVSERQVQRWKLPKPDTTKPANGRVPELAHHN